MQAQLAKILLISGIVMVVLGLFFLMGGKLNFPGRLPGDIYIEKENVKIYIPIMSGLIISLLVTGIIWIIRLFK